MRLTAVILAAAMALTACMKPSETARTVGSGGVRVETLFTHEGCRVYRFYDGRYVYYSNCSGSTQWSESCGKSCIRNHHVTTYGPKESTE